MARILVVDDDKDILTMAERVLAHSGHSTVIATDAIQAMDILNQVNFDLLISDANMPHYSGFDLIKTVRNSKRFDDMGVAMLTSLRERRDVERAVALGADDYIVKPIDPILFVSKVDALFEKKPPGQHPEVQFDESSALAAGFVRTPVVVKAISELGMEVEVNHPLKVGALINLDDTFLERELRIDPPGCRVLTQTETGPLKWQAQIVFVGATEYQLQQIRKWILHHSNYMAKNQIDKAS
jgi:CheY-like chemotaxis protein